MGDKVQHAFVSVHCEGNETKCSHVITHVFENGSVRKGRMGPHKLLRYYESHMTPETKKHLEHMSTIIPLPSGLEIEYGFDTE